MLFAEASDLVQIAQAFFTLIGIVFSGIVAFYTAKLHIGQKAAADKVDIVAEKVKVVAEVAATESVKSEADRKTLHEVHGFTNGAYGLALETIRDLKMDKYRESKDAGDLKAANLAEQKLAEHRETQQRNARK